MGKAKKKTKLPGQPKRPMSAYFLWLNSEGRDKIKEENPGFGVTEVSKKAGEMWAKIDRTLRNALRRRLRLPRRSMRRSTRSGLRAGVRLQLRLKRRKRKRDLDPLQRSLLKRRQVPQVLQCRGKGSNLPSTSKTAAAAVTTTKVETRADQVLEAAAAKVIDNLKIPPHYNSYLPPTV